MTGHHTAAHGFDDAQAVAGYALRPPRLVPGFADMQRMAMLLLAERSPSDARVLVLVLGAGGGLELDLFARDQAGWQFDGIDPSHAMLQLAQSRLEPYGARVRLVEGYVDDAPPGPFDAACSLLRFISSRVRSVAARWNRCALDCVRALRSSARISASSSSRPTVRSGCRATWPSRCPRALLAARQSRPALPSVPDCRFFRLQKTKPSFGKPASAKSRCSMPALAFAAGWQSLDQA
ncbi:class I SAM-dependent methyltransferase [Xylophilus sp. Leaf220]|uniref:class I SAM-dependent methyltransferase n=1 Tax=Xylophilus sp. Leaf220 TaxID=1735686 RepID=UPI001F1D0432|nr:class I SAM-dependent methyltransferase [Xylophilus sp. Leaf220]